MTIMQGVPHQNTQALCKSLPAYGYRAFEVAGCWPGAGWIDYTA